MKLATNMKYLRQKRGWSQDDLAEHLGVSRGKIASYELRDVQPRLPLLTEMASLFEVTVDELIGGKNLSRRSMSKFDLSGSRPQAGQDITLLKERLRHQSDKLKQLYEIIRLKDELLSAKQRQIESLRKQIGEPEQVQSADLHYAADHDQGSLINWQTVEIPSDRYVELSPGISNRLMISAQDFLYGWEKIFEPIALQLDFERQKVILNRSAKTGYFSRHYHPEKETLYCVQGAFREVVSNQMVKSGERIAFEPFQAHEVSFLEDTLIILSLDF